MHYQWEIAGHEKELALLEKDLLTGNISHAYLFAGHENIGKSSIGRKMAIFLQCGGTTDGHVYNEILRGCHGDTIEIVDNNEPIKIDQIRALLEKIHMSSQSNHKVVLIENIGRMTVESGNALLKTLEDPPNGAVFILTANRIRDVLPTIVSRVRLIQFAPVKDSIIETFLGDLAPELPDEKKNSIVEFSMGCPGRAVSFLKDDSLLKSYEKIFTDVAGLLREGDRNKQFVYIERIVKDAKDQKNNGIVKDFLNVMLLSARKEILLAAMQKDIERLNKLIAFAARAHEAEEMLKRNVNGRLLLENLMLSL